MLTSIFAIVFSLLFFIVAISIICYMILISRKNGANDNGTLIYKYFFSNNTVERLLDLEIHSSVVKAFPNKKSFNFVEISKYFEHNKKIMKNFRQIAHAMETEGKDEYFFSDETTLARGIAKKKKNTTKRNYIFNFKYNKLDEVSYILNINWKLIKPDSPKLALRAKPIPVSSQEVADTESKYIGFIAFNIHDDVLSRFLEMISISLNKDFKYMLKESYLIIFFFANTSTKIANILNKNISKLKDIGYKNGLRRLFNGSASLFTQNDNQQKSIRSAIKAIEFYINLSLIKKESFISNDVTGDISNDEFKTYTEALNIFKESVRSGKPNIAPASIRRFSSNRKIVEYAVPQIDGMNKKLFRSLIINQNLENKIINSNATAIAINSMFKQPVLIDVTPKWLDSNYKNIVFKKAIYVVNIHSSSTLESLKEIFDYLRDKKIYFAIKIFKYDDNINSLIRNIKPHFLVLDQHMIKNEELLNSSKYTDVLTISKFAKKENINIIYHNPPSFIDSTIAKNIGLDFYYRD